VEKTTSAGELDYLYDLSGNAVTEWTTSSGFTGWSTGYTYFNGGLVAEYKNDTTYFVHQDHLGSARLVSIYPAPSNPTSPGQWLSENLDYLPFGELNSTDTGIDTHKFTGKERDSESGLDNFEARYYSSSLGRFMRPDPNGAGAATRVPQSWNAYSYVLNNPINATDPTGLWCVWEDNTHDDRPGDGGATEGQCDEQGGHWDPTDTITGMDAAGNMMQEIQVEGVLTDDDRIKIVAAGVDSLSSTSSLSEVGVNGMTWATAAEGLWELPGMIRGGWRAIASWRMASKMAGVRAAGEEGLALAGVVQNTERIPSLTGTAAYRVPDILDTTNKIVGEVKNYSGTLSLTEQIKDDVAFAKANGYTVVLKVSRSTELTQPLRLLVNDGTIKLVRFP
jgi:RHS repeat-associated protein